MRASAAGLLRAAAALPTRRTLTTSAADRRLLRLQRDVAASGPASPSAAHLIRQLNRSARYDEVVRRVEAARWDLAALPPSSAEEVAKAYLAALVRTGKFERRALTDSLRRVGLEAYAAPEEHAAAYRAAAHTYDIPTVHDYAHAAPASAPIAAPTPAAVTAHHPHPLPANSSGTPADPIYVSLAEPSVRSQFWKALRSLGVTFLVLSGVMTLMEDRGIGRSFGVNPEVQPQPAPDKPTKFDDVKGCDEAKAELEEIAEYLRSPSTFTRLGGKLPKGVLLVGPPGTGKTLLARAIAGEAGVPFFYASGSEFEEMFVGVGARRVRDLFSAAKQHAPCILFIDEIDAIGGKRNPKDQMYMKMTLNQLLVELDGFNPTDGIIVIGATNFPETLDGALIRPGRFDRHVMVPNPDVEGRRQILEVHTRGIPLARDVDLEIIARGTPGFSGAELANLANMAALKAALDGLAAVTMSQLEYAKDKILMGAERKSAVISDETRKLTAYHEGGHALVATYTPGALPVHKATIVPRGQALGMVSQLPEKDMTSMTRKQMLAKMDVCMGGRVAEELIFGTDNITSGASSDFEQATQIAEAMVTKYGMSEKLGVVAYTKSRESTETRALIESEVRRLTEASYERARKLLIERRDELEKLAKALLEHETLNGNEVLSAARGQLTKSNTHAGGSSNTADNNATQAGVGKGSSESGVADRGKKIIGGAARKPAGATNA